MSYTKPKELFEYLYHIPSHPIKINKSFLDLSMTLISGWHVIIC
jgi:hypothetical protein